MRSPFMRILSPGPLSTIQDAGRTGYQSLGFTVGGAADMDSMHRANLLCGNDADEGVIEMTLFGITAQFSCDTVIALSGADVSPVVNGVSVEMNRAIALYAGSYLHCAAAKSGVRAYLAVAGGFDVDSVMGSKSTSLKLGIGGFNGRKLAAGDVIPLVRETKPFPDMNVRSLSVPSCVSSVVLRCVPGPQNDMFTSEAMRTLFGSKYTVSAASDRMGIRFDGPALEAVGGTDIISDGIAPGSIQVPSDGKPILLIADHQTTGGYAKIATVISTDMPLAGQLSPGNSVRFSEISVEKAQEIAVRKKAELEELQRKFKV